MNSSFVVGVIDSVRDNGVLVLVACVFVSLWFRPQVNGYHIFQLF